MGSIWSNTDAEARYAGLSGSGPNPEQTELPRYAPIPIVSVCSQVLYYLLSYKTKI